MISTNPVSTGLTVGENPGTVVTESPPISGPSGVIRCPFSRVYGGAKLAAVLGGRGFYLEQPVCIGYKNILPNFQKVYPITSLAIQIQLKRDKCLIYPESIL
jgi:hypothetical protein